MPAFIECGFFILAFGGPTPYQHATDRSYGGILRGTDESSGVARTELYTTTFNFY